MNELFTFDDVLIAPSFSDIRSRKEVSTSVEYGDAKLTLPVISANMDTVTGESMANALASEGAVGCLHRFVPIEENLVIYGRCMFPNGYGPAISIGLGKYELERAEALVNVGATNVVVDVAHGAQMAVVEQVKELRALLGDKIFITVGNFATSDSIKDFRHALTTSNRVDYYKVGVGPGSACTTRLKTGIGVPQLSAIIDCVRTGEHIIADGGMRTPGDVAKALGAGAKLVMLGGMLAGTNETPGKLIGPGSLITDIPKGISSAMLEDRYWKVYRGSASKESYEAQGKDSSYRTAEGESFIVPSKGPVKVVLDDLSGGLRSSMTYVGARNLTEFKRYCVFNRITGNTVKENGAHGKPVV